MNFVKLILSIIFLILPIILIVKLIKKQGKSVSFYEYILLSSGSVLLSILLYLMVYLWTQGQSAFDVMWDAIRQSFANGIMNTDQLLSLYHKWGIFENFTTAEQLGNYIIGQLKIGLPAAIILFSLIYGTVLFLIIRLVLKRLNYEIPAARRFEEWNLPKGMTLGLIILILVSLIGQGLKIRNFEVINFTLTILISFLFTVLGLSVLWFFLKAGRVPAVLRWILIILSYIFLGAFLPLLGLLDQLLHLRVRYRNKFLFKNKKNV